MFSVGLDALLININLYPFFIHSIDDSSLIGLVTTNFCNILPFNQGRGAKIFKFTNEEIKQIIFGSLLGDGKLELGKRSLNARFGFIQSIKFEDYFSYLFSIFSFQNFCSSNFHTYSYLDQRTGNTYTSLNFWTKSLPIFTEFYNQFYINKEKIVPIDLSLLTPLALAHWIMQDGAKGTSGGLYLCTDFFSPEDTRRLANCLSENLQIKVTTPKAPGKNGTLRIYVTVSSMDRLRSLILDHMHPSMLYKLGL